MTPTGCKMLLKDVRHVLITKESELNLAGDEMTSVVDSGALFHRTPDQKCFSSYTAGDHGCVRMGNEGTCRIVGIGDVGLMTPTGCKMLLKMSDMFHRFD